MSSLRRFAAVFAVCALFVAACGDDDDTTTADPPADQTDDDANHGADDGAMDDDDHGDDSQAASDEDIAAQRAALAAASADAGPQTPRDIDSAAGNNTVTFDFAPSFTEMNLCNIHFHEGAEHKGGEFTTYAGNGDGHGYGSGYLYDGELTAEETAAYENPVGATEHGDLEPGDTIEIHFVYSSDDVEPGPTLGSCLADPEADQPLLQVQARVLVLVNDDNGADLVSLTEVSEGDVFQAANIPTDLGDPVRFLGSTTGPSYNEEPSPLQVTWEVAPNVLKVEIDSVEAWLADNIFDEDHAHAVRNLVANPDLLAPIG